MASSSSIDFARLGSLSRDQLIGIAVARGCRHYAPFVREAVDQPDLPHEILGCALLRGPTDVDTFQTIRVGAMILSDTGCSLERIAAAAVALDVASRVAHVARIALSSDDWPDYWRAILSALPAAAAE